MGASTTVVGIADIDSNLLPVIGLVACFFEEFAFRGILRLFPAIDDAARQVQADCADAVFILALDDELSVGGLRGDDCVIRQDDLMEAVNNASIRQAHLLAVNVDPGG